MRQLHILLEIFLLTDLGVTQKGNFVYAIKQSFRDNIIDKNMRNSSKSFANQFGITQKQLTSNPSMGIGLNPNLNIEDQYIQNLLKQVHFLNMEIKLIKQKQKENKGLGIMGLLNKDTNPVVTHAITSNDKFTQMKTKLEGLVNQSTSNKLRLEDQNFAVKAQKDYVDRLNLKQEQKNIENKMYVDKQLTEGVEKLRNNQNRLQELRAEASKTSDTYQRIKREFEDLDIKDKAKILLKAINDNLQQQSTVLEEKHFNRNNDKYQINKGRLQEADKLFREDPKYKELTQENVELKDKLKLTDKQLFDLNYKVKQMEELKKMCIRNKDVEQELKKQAGEETERLKKRLGDKKQDMESKLADSKAGLDTNDEIRLMKGKIARKEKQTADLRRKTEISENNYKRLRDEVQKMQAELEVRKEKNKQKEEQIAKQTLIMNDTDGILRKTELDYQKVEADLKNADGELKQTRKRLEDLEEECSYLIAKQQYLTQSIDMDQNIRKVKIQQLTNLMQSNLGLNNTITDLMGKWEQIIKFSREPPGSV